MSYKSLSRNKEFRLAQSVVSQSASRLIVCLFVCFFLEGEGGSSRRIMPTIVNRVADTVINVSIARIGVKQVLANLRL